MTSIVDGWMEHESWRTIFIHTKSPAFNKFLLWGLFLLYGKSTFLTVGIPFKRQQRAAPASFPHLWMKIQKKTHTHTITQQIRCSVVATQGWRVEPAPVTVCVSVRRWASSGWLDSLCGSRRGERMTHSRLMWCFTPQQLGSAVARRCSSRTRREHTRNNFIQPPRLCSALFFKVKV